MLKRYRNVVSQCESRLREFEKVMLKRDSIVRIPNMQVVYQVLSLLNENFESFDTYMPLVRAMLTPGLKGKHIHEILNVLGVDDSKTISSRVTLKILTKYNAPKKIEEIRSICSLGGIEHVVEETLDKFEQVWKTSCFLDVIPDEESHVVLDGEACDHVFDMIQEQLIKCESLKHITFSTPYLDRIVAWQRILTESHGVIERLVHTQSQWRRVTPLFVTQGLANDTFVGKYRSKYHDVDKLWTSILDGIHDKPYLLSVSKDTDCARNLDRVSKGLAELQRVCETFVQRRRHAYPRLYLLSTDECVKLLGTRKRDIEECDSSTFRELVGKMYSAWGHLCCRDSETHTGRSIHMTNAIRSKDGETLCFETPVQSTNPNGDGYELLDAWFCRIYNETRQTLKSAFQKTIRNFSSKIVSADWISKTPFHVVRCCLGAYITSRIESAFKKQKRVDAESEEDSFSMSNALRNIESEILLMIDRIMISSTTTSSSSSSSKDATIVLLLHHRDVLRVLIEKSKSLLNRTCLAWQIQMRDYWNEEEEEEEKEILTHVMLNYRVQHGFEYAGGAGASHNRLVVTPITMRCFRCLLSTTLDRDSRYGTLTGYPGIGKRSVLSQLSSWCGMGSVLRFDMQSAVDDVRTISSVANLLRCGVACGLWVSLENVSCLSRDTASTLGVLLETLRRELSKQTDSVSLYDVTTTVFCTRQSAVFMTSHAQSEISSELREQCRIVGLSRVSTRRVAEVLLHAGGCKAHSEISSRLVRVLDMIPNYSTRRARLDLRTLRDVLRYVFNKSSKENSWQERVLEGVRHEAFSLVTDATCQRDIDEICTSILTGTKSIRSRDRNKESELSNALTHHNGIILLGSHGTGKSTLLRCVAGQDKNLLWTYPDAHSVEDIVGSWNQENNKFQAGLFASMLYVAGAAVVYEHEKSTFGLHRLSRCVRGKHRMSNQEKKFKDNTSTWLVLDGPLRSHCVDYLASMCDDENSLRLADGHELRLRHDAKIILETTSLASCTPTTLSRYAVVSIAPNEVFSWYETVDLWLKRNDLPKQLAEWIQLQCKTGLNVLNVSKHAEHEIVSSFLRVLDTLLMPIRRVPLYDHQQVHDIQLLARDVVDLQQRDDSGFVIYPNAESLCSTTLEAKLTLREGHAGISQLECLSFVAMMWSFVPLCQKYCVEKFSTQVFDKLKNLRSWMSQVPVKNSSCPLDWYYDLQSDTWSIYKSKDTTIEESCKDAYVSPMWLHVPESRAQHTMEMWARMTQHYPTLLVGATSSVRRRLLSNVELDDIVTCHLNAKDMSEKLFRVSVLRRMNRVGTNMWTPPERRKKLVCFVEDLQDSTPDVHALLRQYLERGGWFTRNTNEAYAGHHDFTKVKACQFAAHGVLDSSSETWCRLRRHFNVLRLVPNSSICTTSILEQSVSNVFESQFQACRLPQFVRSR